MTSVYGCTGHVLKIPDVANSRGAYLFDSGGKRFMDLESGVWCVPLGHNNERVNDALRSQIRSLMHAGFCYSHPVLEAAAEAVLEIAGLAGGQCVFLCSGSEAIEVSRQMARHLTDREMSMTLHDSYLGAYTSVTDRRRGWHLFDWEGCRSCEKQAACDPACEAIGAIPDAVSDFVFEPGSASGFVRFPPVALIRTIVRAVRERGGKIIANEVTTGVGRTGKWFGFQHYGIEPDFVAVGKGIGNGYPVSAAVIHSRAAAELASRPFRYAQSHQNDPLGAAVACAVLQEMKERGLVRRAEQNGPLFFSRLESLVDGRTVLAVRGRGMMFAVDLADRAVADRFYTDLLHRGFIVGNRGAAFRIDPPLILTEAEFDDFIDAFREVKEGTMKPAPVKETVTLQHLEKLDIRAGTILAVSEVQGSGKLMKLTVDFGDHKRSILAGIKRERDDPREIEGKQALFVLNLPEKKMAGEVSQGMLFDIGYADGITPCLAVSERRVPDGARAG